MSRPIGMTGRETSMRVNVPSDHLAEAGGEREQGLARAGLADEGDEADAVVQQQIEGERLLAVLGADAHHALARDAEREHLLLGTVVAAERGVGVRLAVAQHDRGVRLEVVGLGGEGPWHGERVDLALLDLEIDDPALEGLRIDLAVLVGLADMPSASARMRRLVSIVTKMVGRLGSASRTSSAVLRIAWSCALWSRATGNFAALGHGDAERAEALPEAHALGQALVAGLAQLVEVARDLAAVAAALGALALNWSISSMTKMGMMTLFVLELVDPAFGSWMRTLVSRT